MHTIITIEMLGGWGEGREGGRVRRESEGEREGGFWREGGRGKEGKREEGVDKKKKRK